MEDLDAQLLTKHSIDRALINLNKLGKAKWTHATLVTRIQHLQSNWAKFATGHARLLASVTPAERSDLSYFTDDVYSDTEVTYLDSLSSMQSKLNDLPGTTVSHLEQSSAEITHTPTTESHLPRVGLPEFDGRYEAWESFRDRFSALIIANKSLAKVTRLHYLLSCLTGCALDCVAKIPVTDDNFDIAWNTLTERFENPRRLINVHLKSLLGLHSIERESATELQALRDRVSIILKSLKNLGREPAELWNDILVHIISNKLDAITRKEWKVETSENVKPPSYDSLIKFIDSRVRALEEFESEQSASASSSVNDLSHVHVNTASQSSTSLNFPCPICRASHLLSSCSQFKSRSPRERRDLVNQFSRCVNCLSPKHFQRDCPSKHSCRECHKRHHSLLHEQPNLTSSTPSTEPTQAVNTHFASTPIETRVAVLLATAWVQLSVPSGPAIPVRALIDQGSEATFITEAMVPLLGAKRVKVETSISAVGGVHAGNVRHAVRLCISSRTSASPSITTVALVLPSLSTYTPKRRVDLRSLSHLSHLDWADPDPSSPSAIHLILGADVYADIILDGVRKGPQGHPIAQNSIFGWVISGHISRPTHDATQSSVSPFNDSPLFMHHCVREDSLSNDLKRFWEIEEIPQKTIVTAEEEYCESYFRRTTSRTADGRYVVRLPFRKGPPIDIGRSYAVASRINRSLQRKLTLKPSLGQEYRQFLREYEGQGHMQPISSASLKHPQCVYIPHHPVLREGSATSHLRVVFNASSATSNGTSLNDHLLPGPKLQSDLPTIILRWRNFRYVYTADIEKMYRQILVDIRDLDYQRIIWQHSPETAPTSFQLLTVTYGMTCAPFLALRVLQRLVEDEGSQFPFAVPILRANTYVDDVLFGANDIPTLLKSRDQLNSLLKLGQMTLRKWASNHTDLLADINPSNHGLACSKILDPEDHVKVLGIAWNPAQDSFHFNVSLSNTIPSTKRTILSTIAKLYDPLGWVTPSIILAKILIQDLWRLQVGWDDPIPNPILDRWSTIYTRLSLLSGVQISRWIGHSPPDSRMEIHGFADASTVAYAAVVYARCVSNDGRVTVSLLAGKSKVAPLSPVTIPRLELQAAVLLSRLVTFVLSSFENQDIPCFCWTDSTVVLAWLQSHPSRWKTYVAHRVADVQARLPHANWRHVTTADNPADCSSRGLLSNELLEFSLWWQGPVWLIRDSSEWPFPIPIQDDMHPPEVKVSLHCSSASSHEWDLVSRYSNWPKLLRVTAYVLRFVCSCRKVLSNMHSSLRGRALSSDDISCARRFWIKHIQSVAFPAEIRALRNNSPLSTKSPLLSLNAFLDHDGILRVGGRLHHSFLPSRSKHPILLAPHRLVRILVEQIHSRTLHGGVQLTLLTLRQDYWLLRARNVVKKVIHECITCVREKAAVPEQLMGNLPAARVSPPTRCFAHCGMDYAGPFSTRASAGRGITCRKSYVALFICMATKAIHLEVVVDYSTLAFLNAYLRFCSRRGLPEAVYSDNGTTFVGGNRELSIAYRSALRNPEFQNKTAGDGTAWHFIPPSAPHFGGLWEAGVKSVKHHLRRVLGDRKLTYEEFNTLLCSIEACLNSRPLSALSDTLDDYDPLTPGHFLVGSVLTVPPQPSYLDLGENRLSRWQLIRQTAHRFWKLWQNDFINSLQQRGKWRTARPCISLGQLVLLRNPNIPPCKWDLGRVTELHSGDDGLVRVVTVRTATSTFKRPLVQVCPLPVNCNPDTH